MRLPIIPIVLLNLLNTAVDYYLYRKLKNHSRFGNLAKYRFWVSLALTVGLVVVVSLPRRSGSDSSLLFIMWSLFVYLTIYIPKYIAILFDLIANLPRFWKKAPWRKVSVTGIIMGCISFLLMWWGALVTRNNIEVVEVDVKVENLPEAFDGYRIAQISDLHVGTYYDDTTFVYKLVSQLNGLDVDAIMFTGDIVNRNTKELIPFVETLSRMNAKDGVFSVLGNHDYGDYSDWESIEAKQENQRLMCELQDKMGWRLLLNEAVYVYRENDSIAVVGVENVGDPPFKNYGSLGEATSTLDDDVTKILLSHNPAHWEQEISDKKSQNIALTLSGHTHAMQMSLFGLSPAALRYKYWGGMYTDDSGRQNLYVNQGLGTVAIPMRIGATPEITLITLRK